MVLRENHDTIGAVAAHLKAVERVMLSGVDTSWHACLVGELLLAGIGNLGHRVRAFHSFELKNYWPDPDSKTATIVVSHRGTKRFSLEALEKVKTRSGLAVTRAAREVGASVVGLVQEGHRELSVLCVRAIALPPVPEALTPLLAVVPLQLFTYHLALQRGRNPDTMRGDQPAHARARASFSL
ncbi:MAG: hypothetical protein ACE5JD_15600 [Candidatus Methylomirabilia bacterium]